jgi:hypothetical protein
MSRYPARRPDSGGRSAVFGTRGAVAYSDENQLGGLFGRRGPPKEPAPAPLFTRSAKRNRPEDPSSITRSRLHHWLRPSQVPISLRDRVPSLYLVPILPL